jgi:uncharacterized protein (DUF849 family)
MNQDVIIPVPSPAMTQGDQKPALRHRPNKLRPRPLPRRKPEPAIVHIHVRGRNRRVRHGTRHYREVVKRIREQVDVIVNLTCGMGFPHRGFR